MAIRSQRAARDARRPPKVVPARWVAHRVIHRTFTEQAYTDRAFAGEAERAGLEGRDRAFSQALAYGTVQRAKTLDHIIATCGKRPLRKIDGPVLTALRLGTYELVYGEGTGQHAAIDQAVEIVRATVGERAVAFTNAVLRRAQVDAADIIDALDMSATSDIATALSFPEWMVESLQHDFGVDGIDALAAQNTPRSGTAVRVNTLLADEDELEAELAADGLVLGPVEPSFGDALPDAGVVTGSTASLAPFAERGVIAFQSLSSQLATVVLDPHPGERVVDLCAAPGGKTTHAAALMCGEGSITACELHEHRARSISFLAARLGCSGIVHVRTGDATTLTIDELGGAVDRVLVDAPCSGLGVLDARPDARWRHDDDGEIAGLVDIQRKLLSTASTVVRPGGIVTYSTCTLLPAENELAVRWVIDQGLLEPAPMPDTIPEWLTLPDAPHMVRIWPHLHRSAGFFIARLRRPGGEA